MNHNKSNIYRELFPRGEPHNIDPSDLNGVGQTRFREWHQAGEFEGMDRTPESLYSHWNKYKTDIFKMDPNTSNRRPAKKPARAKRKRADDPLEGPLTTSTSTPNSGRKSGSMLKVGFTIIFMPQT